ncbi:hypothetical protein BH09SUM1_BH09SUM1_00530 [soil metagenome]
MMTESRKAWQVLTMNTIAFAACFAAWMMNGVLITFLSTKGIYDFNASQVSLLIATPVLTGSLLRLPLGILTDRFGGRRMQTILLVFVAAALWINSMVNTYPAFLLCALAFGCSGASFAIGVSYTSVWFDRARQGTALGIFGAGNTGTAITLLFAPKMLEYFTGNGAVLDGWRRLPQVYAIALLIVAVLYYFLTFEKTSGVRKTLVQRLRPLAVLRVWRFGLYYFVLFGSFVALSQWLVPYFVKAYALPLATAGFLASCFSLPCGGIRALGGWLSDRLGARTVLYGVFTCLAVFCFLLSFPRMEILTPGEGILARSPGRITSITARELVIENSASGKSATYKLSGEAPATVAPAVLETTPAFMPLPVKTSWQVWAGKRAATMGGGEQRAFQVGDEIKRMELLAAGTSRISFQANIAIFTILVLLLGLAMGIGMAAVYKHIPTYFGDDVGAVGGLVGVIGGLGGFVLPIVFGALLNNTGLWTTCWLTILLLALLSLAWMHIVVKRIVSEAAPGIVSHFDQQPATTQVRA